MSAPLSIENLPITLSLDILVIGTQHVVLSKFLFLWYSFVGDHGSCSRGKVARGQAGFNKEQINKMK